MIRIFSYIWPLLVFVGSVSARADKTLTIYTSSNENFIQPIFDEYTKETGVKIRFLSDKGPVLIEKLKAEGTKSPADIFMTVDVGNLWLARETGLLSASQSAILLKNIPPIYRDPNRMWFGLSMRARTLFYQPSKVKQSELRDYEDLASPKWRKRLCLRTSNNVYNQSLVASFIENKGLDKAEKILKGWVENLAGSVYSNDTLLLEAIAEGKCDVGIANSYYYGRLLKEKPSFPVKVYWPKDGVHVNIMGAGVTAHSTKKVEALKFLEWASGVRAQKLFASLSFEYPVNKESEIDPLVASWGKFVVDKMPLYKAGEKQKDAVKLMDKVGYR